MRIFSGIRPTGEIHIGNYLGALKQWVDFQDENECIFCVVDLHAITTPYEPEKMQKNILDLSVDYLAAGLDPEKCIIFVQSQVKEHTELAWLLGSITPFGELYQMTQFKDKSKKHPEYVNAGLLNYPLLMASDILLYQSDAVPVGIDQKQHVELTREIARRFNKKFGNIFKEPVAMTAKMGEKIMSLQSPKKKMSKTDNSNGYIGLFDEPEDIRKKIGGAVTDTGKVVKFDPKKKPGISNLLMIYSLFSDMPIGELEKTFKKTGYADFKTRVSDLLISKLEPFRRKKKELLQRDVYVKEILAKGEKKAQVIAQSTMREVKKRMGLL